MRKVGGSTLAVFASLALSAGFCGQASAQGGPSVQGAIKAVVRAVREEGGQAVYYGTPQVRCHRERPSRFGCHFFDLRRGRGGSTTVAYEHGHYNVGELRYEAQREVGELPRPEAVSARRHHHRRYHHRPHAAQGRRRKPSEPKEVCFEAGPNEWGIEEVCFVAAPGT
jgi:hypothetical protein